MQTLHMGFYRAGQAIYRGREMENSDMQLLQMKLLHGNGGGGPPPCAAVKDLE